MKKTTFELNMWILLDWLEPYQPVSHIRDGKTALSGARMLENSDALNPHYIYVGSAGNPSCPSDDQEIVLCTNQYDIISLRLKNLEPSTVLNALLNAFDFYSHWSESLSDLTVHGNQIEELLSGGMAALKNPVYLIDQNGSICAEHFPASEQSSRIFETVAGKKRFRPGYLTDFIRSGQSGQRFTSLNLGQSTVRACQQNLYDNSEVIGQLIVLEQIHPFSVGYMEIISFLSLCLQRWISNHPMRACLLSPQKVFQAFLEDCESSISSDFFKSHLDTLGWQPNDPKQLLLLKHPKHSEKINPHFCSLLSQSFSNCIISSYPDAVIIIINIKILAIDTFIASLKRLLKQNGYYAGTSFPFQNMKKIKTYYYQALLALQNGSQSPGAVNDCSTHTLLYICQLLDRYAEIDLCHPSLEILRQYDQSHHTQLLHTLDVWLSNERSNSLTADCLSIHRNSLNYRLQKIKDLLNMDFDCPDIRLTLMISFCLYRQRHPTE